MKLHVSFFALECDVYETQNLFKAETSNVLDHTSGYHFLKKQSKECLNLHF